jgi:hypothetical protein
VERSGTKNLLNPGSAMHVILNGAKRNEESPQHGHLSFKMEILHFVQDDNLGSAFKREILHCVQDDIRGSDI